MPIIEDHNPLQKLLQESRIIAIVGITPDPHKPSHFVSKAVKRFGFKMRFINPHYAGEDILGEAVFSSLKDVPEDLDIVDVFRRPEFVGPVAAEARDKGFKTFWLQPGTENWDVIQELDQEGYNVVPGLCLKTCCQLLL